MDRRSFSTSLLAALGGSSIFAGKSAFGALPAAPSGIAIDGVPVASPAPAPVSAPSGPLKASSGTLVIAPGATGDQRIDVEFTPSVVIFFSSASFYQRTMTYAASLPLLGGKSVTGSAVGICMGAYDGTRQWSQQHAVTFADGRRDGYLWRDAIYDAGADLGSGTNNIGAKIVGKSISGNIVTLGISRPSLPTDGAITMNWLAIGGCNARIGFLSVPYGGYHENPPQGVTASGLPFKPRGVIFAPWRQTNSGTGGSTFFTATVGSAIGFASGPTLPEQAAVGSTDGYGGHTVSFAYQGCIAGSSRQDHADNPTYLGRLARFTDDGFVVDFQSSDSVAQNDGLPFIAMDCACSAGQSSLRPDVGTISITGAAFTPKAAIFGAVPTVESNYTVPWTPLNYGSNGDENTSFGFAVNSAGSPTQSGISFFDKGGYDAAGNLMMVNGHETDTTAMHDGNAVAFSNAVLKSQTRTSFQSFSQNAAASVSRFLVNGVELTQSQANGRAGKIAYLLLGDAT